MFFEIVHWNHIYPKISENTTIPLIEPILTSLETVLIITLVAAVVIIVGLYVWWVGPVLFRRKPLTGAESLLGKKGTVTSDVSSDGGEVNVEGIIWKATSSDGTISAGETVVVTSVTSLTLTVKKIEK